jgi:hypothetical protein
MRTPTTYQVIASPTADPTTPTFPIRLSSGGRIRDGVAHIDDARPRSITTRRK